MDSSNICDLDHILRCSCFLSYYMTIIVIFAHMSRWLIFWMNRENPNNCGHHHDSMQFLVITQISFSQARWGRFGLSQLYFEMYARFISSLLHGTNSTLTAIDLLFVSNFFQPFACEGKFVFPLTQSYKGGNLLSLCRVPTAFWNSKSRRIEEIGGEIL